MKTDVCFLFTRTGIVAMAAYAALGSSSALAAEATWILDGTGAFTNGLNWSTGSVPGPADSAVLSIGGVTQISAADDITVDLLTVSMGGVSFSGGKLTSSGSNDVRVGSNGGTGSLTMNLGELAINSSLRFGDNGIAAIDITDATISQQNGYMIFGGGGGGSATATFSGDSQLSHLGNWFIFGDGVGTSAEVTFKDATEVLTNEWTFFGKGGAANVTFEGDSTFTNTAGATIVGEGNPSSAAATLTLKDNVVFQHEGSSFFPVGHNGGTGSLIMSGSSQVSVAGEVYIGNDGGAEQPSNGTLDMSGDSTFTTVGTKFVISRYNGSGTVNVSGNATLDVATSIVVGENGTANMTISDTATVKAGSGANIYIGSGPFSSNDRSVGNGTVTMNGGNLIALDGNVVFGTSNANNAGTNNVGTLNLNGGTVTANGMTKGVGTGTVNFNGATVKTGADNADYFSGFEASDLHVQSGGFKFDTNGFTVSVSQGLSGAGELRKLGEGILHLLGENLLTGTASVTDGTLTIDGSLMGVPTLSVAAGASLELANPDAIALNDNIVLNLVTGSQMVLSFSGIETIGALSINGNYLAPGEYTLAELQAEAAGIFSGNSNAVVNVTAVPEPGTLVLLSLGGAILVARNRKRRRD